MSAHTPGPWLVERAIGSASRYIIAPEPGRWNCIASTWDGPHEANARLIAAAPALLRLVKVVAQWPGNNPLAVAARAVIAKVEP